MIQRIIIIVLIVGFFAFILLIGIRNKISNIGSTGKSPINKYLFILAKLTMIVPWIAILIRSYTPKWIPYDFYNILVWISISLLLSGFMIVIIAYISLGRHTKFGLPTEKTKLITAGIFKFSRNPMYLGLFMMLVGSIIYYPHWILILNCVIAVIIHHKVVLGEEKFLKKTFGNDWEQYLKTSKRYI